MNENDEIVKLYTGGDVIISRIKQELAAADINCLTKDRFKQALAAGYGDGVPSAIDILVVKKDFEEANRIVKAITEE